MKLTVHLSSPLILNGIQCDRVTLREPTLGDQIEIEKLALNPLARTKFMLARLIECAPDELQQLTLRDLDRLEKAYLRLVSDADHPDDTVLEIST